MTTSFNALVEAFNFNPITYLDPSWLPIELKSSDGQLINIHNLSFQAQIQLSEYVLFRHGLIAYSDLFFNVPTKRLALLDAKLLLELSAILGLAIYKESLRTAIDRETIANLKANYSQQHLALVLKLAADIRP
jgi:hypothetical protein